MSNITNAIYTDADHRFISADFDGKTILSIPVGRPGQNRRYDEIVEQAIVIAPFVPQPSITEEQKTTALLDDPRMADVIAAIDDATPNPRDTVRNAAIAKARARDGV